MLPLVRGALDLKLGTFLQQLVNRAKELSGADLILLRVFEELPGVPKEIRNGGEPWLVELAKKTSAIDVHGLYEWRAMSTDLKPKGIPDADFENAGLSLALVFALNVYPRRLGDMILLFAPPVFELTGTQMIGLEAEAAAAIAAIEASRRGCQMKLMELYDRLQLTILQDHLNVLSNRLGRRGRNVTPRLVANGIDEIIGFQLFIGDPISNRADYLEVLEMVVQTTLDSLGVFGGVAFTVTGTVLPSVPHRETLAMILAELVTNSVRHGFSGLRRSGKISVQLDSSHPGFLEMTYSDTGRGLPKNFSRMENLGGEGLALVDVLMQLIGGSLEIETGGLHKGFHAVLTFPK